MKKYGLIGAGMMGQEHIRNLNLFEGIELVALAEPNAFSLEQSCSLLKNKPNLYHSHLEMMRNENNLDAVIIATPNHTHFEIVLKWLDQDVALLVEKPLCTNHQDARRLAEKAKRRKSIFWVGLEYRYMPPVTRFIERLRQGEVGKIQMLSIREHRFPFLPKVDNWNRFNKNTGGTLVEKCCHFFDLMRVILQDEPIRIYASGAQDVNHLDERYNGQQPDIIDNAYVIVDFSKNSRAILDLCMFAEGSKDQEEIYALGHKGKLEVKIPDAHIVSSPRSNRDPVKTFVDTPKEALIAGHHHGATYFQLQRFHAALTHQERVEVTADDGLRSVEMGLAAQKSLLEKRPIDLNFTS